MAQLDYYNLSLFKSKLSLLEELKRQIIAIREQFSISTKDDRDRDLMNYYLIDLMKYLDVIINNAGRYLFSHANFLQCIIRNRSSGGYEYAFDDIEVVDKAAVKCIGMIDKNKKPK